MKKKSTSQSAFFNLRVLIGLFVFLAGVFLALLGFGTFSKASAQSNASVQNQPPSGPPTVVPMVGPVAQNQDLRSLPYVAPAPEIEEKRLTRYPRPETGAPAESGASSLAQFQSLMKGLLRPVPTMPGPLLTFDGVGAQERPRGPKKSQPQRPVVPGSIVSRPCAAGPGSVSVARWPTRLQPRSSSRQTGSSS